MKPESSKIPALSSKENHPSPSAQSLWVFSRVALATGGILALLLALGLYPRLQRQMELTALAKAAKRGEVLVNTTKPHPAKPTTEITLPGSIQALQETTLYSRTSGYLAQRSVDIGDRVEAGQVLAEIDSPETDQEVAQAQASLAQASANYAQAQANLEQAKAGLVKSQADSDFARTSAQRWQTLQKDGAVSLQDADQRLSAAKANQAMVNASESVIAANQASVASTQANVAASRANLQRLEALQSYKQIVAPFAGVITGRNVDTGTLIAAGSGGSNAVWLFKLAQADRLRIFVNVPQSWLEAIRPGQSVNLLVRELPKQTFAGTVVRTSEALDPTTHTLLTEVQVPNPSLKLRPGMYAQVKFLLKRPTAPLMISSSTLVFRAEGPQVAIVDSNQKVHYQSVTLGRDYGAEVEVTAGLEGDEDLVVNPTDEVREGSVVKVADRKKG